MQFVPSLGIPAGSAAASIPAGGWKAWCPILLSSWCITSPKHVPTLLYLGLAWHPPTKIWDVQLWAVMVRLSEGSLSQLIETLQPSPKLPNKLDPKTVLSPPTSSHPWQPAQLAQLAPTPSGYVGTQGWRLRRCGDSPLCTSPVLRSCSTGTSIVDTGTGSAINTTSSSTWDHLLHHTGVMGNQIARWGGDHQRMLTHIQCANVCT